MPIRIHRRTLLRGAGGVAIGLPALEIMGLGRRAHAAPPARFVLSYGGMSTGAYKPQDQVVPDTVGRGYDVKRGLAPLTEMSLRDDVSIVTGLVIPWSAKDDEAVPPGGRSRFFHFNTVGPQVAGTATPKERAGRPRGPTADQIVADAIAGTTPQKVLAYRVQAAANHADAGRLSWKTGSNGALVPHEPIASPRVAFESLFAGFVPPSAGGMSEADKRAAFMLRQRKSVLDVVRSDMATLVTKLGPADKLRLQRHADEIRSLEQRLAGSSPGASAALCMKPAAPGTDPAIGAAGNYAYNGEDQRADVMTELIALAFACDLSRSASFMLTEWKCYMNAKSFTGIDSDMHELTHGAGPLESISDSLAWHVRQWGKLIGKLKARKEADGSALLDHTALVLVFEGGHGYDPEGGTQNAAHSTENMVALVAGRAGGLKPGAHVAAKGKHPAHAVVSAMRAAGVAGEQLGDVKGVLPELFA